MDHMHSLFSSEVNFHALMMMMMMMMMTMIVVMKVGLILLTDDDDGDDVDSCDEGGFDSVG